jgi:hypothetical protein
MAAYKIARLAQDQADLIQGLEKDLDVCMIAMEPGLEIAELEENDLKKVKDLEQKLGVTLIVYRSCD